MNEWEALKFAFKRTTRTKDLFSVIDRYESTTAAFEGGNDGQIMRSIVGPQVMLSFGSTESGDPVVVIVMNKYEIHEMAVVGLDDDDILQGSYLPKHLKVLNLSLGTLTRVDLEKLPRELEVLVVGGNRISKMEVESLPPHLELLYLGFNPLAEGVTLR